ncbi:MAG: CvpA family protein [Candidatus Aminicenantales bacterium]|jgi:membrane protein required for colicin V production
MAFNWLDILLAVAVLSAVIVGLVKGFVRELIGLIVIIIGIVVAARVFGPVARFAGKFISNVTTANFVGFLLVFLAVLIVGGILAGFIARLTKGGLGFANHVLGGLIGFVEGILVAGAVVFAMLAFPVNKNAVNGSRLAPSIYEFTKTIVRFIPRELKDQIRDAYENISKGGADHGKEI